MRIKPDPMGERRNPFQVYLLCLSILSGIVTMIPAAESPTSAIDAMLDAPWEFIWGGMLAGGSVLTLLGMFWQGDARTALVVKRMGLVTLIVPTLVFSIGAVWYRGWGGTLISMTVLGFAAACIVQAHTVNRRIQFILARSDDGGEAS